MLNEIKNSIWGPEYYKKVRETPLKDAFKYYFKLTLILALVASILPSFALISLSREVVSEESVAEMVSLFPAELEIKNKGGVLSSSVDEPYFISGEKYRLTKKDLGDKTNLVVINTKDNFDLQTSSSFDTLAVLSKDSITVFDEKGKITIYQAKELPEVTLNRANLNVWLSKAAAVLEALIPILPIVLILIFIMVYICYLAHVFIFALIVWLFLKLGKESRGYADALKITLHSITAILIISLFTYILRVGNLPLLAMVLTSVIAITNITRVDKEKSPTPSAPTI